MDIAAATADDQADIVALWQACGLTVAYNDPGADFLMALGRENSDVLAGRDPDGRIVATAMVGHDGHRGWLYYVAVAPGLQGGGRGRAMVAAANAWLRARGIRKVQLLVRETNTQVVAFYERLGFETAPRVVMSRWLDAGD